MKADFKVAIQARFAPAPRRGKPKCAEPKAAETAPSRPPRIAVLMALAIHMEQLLRYRMVKDQAELARLTGVTPARVAQIMNLLGLVPALQEHLLIARPSQDSIRQRERTLRHIASMANWHAQRGFWNQNCVAQTLQTDIASSAAI